MDDNGTRNNPEMKKIPTVQSYTDHNRNLRCSVCGEKMESWKAILYHGKRHSEKDKMVIHNEEEENGHVRSSRPFSHMRPSVFSKESNDAVESLLLLSVKAVCFSSNELHHLDESDDHEEDQNLIDDENDIGKLKLYDSESDTDDYFNDVEMISAEPLNESRKKMWYTTIKRKRTKRVQLSAPSNFKSRNNDEGGSSKNMNQCSDCKRVFGKHHALGGHKAHSNKMNDCAIEVELKMKDGSSKMNSSIGEEKKRGIADLNLVPEGMEDENKDSTGQQRKDEREKEMQT